MKKMQCFFSVIVAVMICFWATFVCFASENKSADTEGILLVVVDQSKETYGAELKDAVYNQLKKQVKGFVKEELKLNGVSSKNADVVAKAEQPELLELANDKGAKQVLIVEILPTKSDFSDIILYKAIKSEATLRIRLYDKATKQYMLNETVSGIASNKTYIPYTGVGKKITVLEAVHKATDIVAQKVNQSVISVN
jgi:hypothetical protein